MTDMSAAQQLASSNVVAVTTRTVLGFERLVGGKGLQSLRQENERAVGVRRVLLCAHCVSDTVHSRLYSELQCTISDAKEARRDQCRTNDLTEHKGVGDDVLRLEAEEVGADDLQIARNRTNRPASRH